MPERIVADVAFVAGGGLLLWSSWIHYDLWLSEGYRHISTIGPLFVVQAIGAAAFGILVIARRDVLVGSLAAGSALVTMIGFLCSVSRGLLGFRDSWSAPFASQAFAIELAATALLGLAVVLCLVRRPALSPASRVHRSG